MPQLPKTKEFGIITSANGLARIGTLSGVEDTLSAQHSEALDHNGNVIGESFTKRVRQVVADMELIDRSKLPAVGQTLLLPVIKHTVNGGGAVFEKFIIHGVAVAEQNSGEPATVKITARRNIPLGG